MRKKITLTLIFLFGFATFTMVGCKDITSPVEGINSAINNKTFSESNQGRRFTIPAQYFGSQSEDEARHTLTENQATNIVKNQDGSYTVTMTNDAFNSFVAMNKKQTQNALQALVDNQSYPGITKVEALGDLNTVTCTTTNSSETDAEIKAAEYIIYLVCLYQTIAGETLACHTTFLNPAGQVVYSKSYPES